jgi:SAM-dependent methyltransferase
MSGPPRIFDPILADMRRQRALVAGVAGADFLERLVTEDIAERLATVKRQFGLAVEIGSRRPVVADTGQVDRVVRLDRLATIDPGVVGDAELLPFKPGSLDLVISVLSLHTANDLPGALAQIRRALKPDGLFLAAFLGGDTLTELRQSLAAAEAEVIGGASPRVAPFTEVRTAGALLQRAGFALPVADFDSHTVRYPSALHLMHDLRAMGLTNALVERSRRPLRRAILTRTVEVYGERFADADGRVRATFEVISLSGWSPHESQQKPLKPGSARMRLADALGTSETPAGEKAGR